LTSCKPVSFSRRTVLHRVSSLSYLFQTCPRSRLASKKVKVGSSEKVIHQIILPVVPKLSRPPLINITHLHCSLVGSWVEANEASCTFAASFSCSCSIRVDGRGRLPCCDVGMSHLVAWRTHSAQLVSFQYQPLNFNIAAVRSATNIRAAPPAAYSK
jgi:hypothetical protein